jgi:signal transduction histidine kinase
MAHESGLRRYLAHGESRMLGRRIEVEAMSADGRRFPVELAVVATRLDGKPFFVAYLRDISEARKARLAIEQSAAELGAVLELSPDGYIVFGADQRCSRLNAAGAALTGLLPEATLGLSLGSVDRRLQDASGLTGAWPGLASLVDGDHGELRFARPKPAIVRYAYRVLPGSDGTILGSALQLRDITRQTELDCMKSEFLATAAHELRTPLTTIHGFIELLLTRDFDSHTRLDLLTTMQRDSARLVAMLSDLLDLARIEARRGSDFRIAAQPLAPMLAEALDGFPLPADRLPLPRPECNPTLELPMDRIKIIQALRNLLSNACKYSPADAPIRVLVRDHDPERIGIAVSDAGIGIPVELQTRVFERFFRADQSGASPGTGLGLALVREIIGLHGGQVSLDSTVGRGTTVTLWLPRLLAHPPLATRTAT